MRELLNGLKALGVARLAAMGAVAVCMLAVLAVLALRGGTEHMALLYADLDLKEAGQIADALDRQHIPAQTGRQGSEILVPESMVTRARLLLAREGLPSGGAIGYEIFDRGDGLVASQFQQSISQTRALEGELARTIRSMQGVRNARVHVVLPRREPFATQHQDAQASVLLTLAGANRLDHEAVQAILTLVAAAVPGLRVQNIAIADTHGSLLARAGQAMGGPGTDNALDEQRRATEMRLAHAVEDMLEPSLGQGRVRAEAAVDMDFDQVHETQEKFDPEGQVVRGTQTSTDTSKSTEAQAPTTVQNNLPNADAAAASGAGSQEQKQEETTNYEIGKTVRTIVREHPQIRRISIAVMIDGIEIKDGSGAVQWKPRPQDDIDRITTLVRSAIGYNEKRGDRIDVVSMRFAIPEAASSEAGALAGLFDKSDLMRLGQTGLLGVLALLALLFVLRPMVQRITSLPAAIEGPEPLAMLAAGAGGGAGMTAGAAPGGQLLLAGTGAAAEGGALVPYEEGDNMVNIANIEGQMRASSIRRVIDLVQTHPDESLSILRAWMQQEAPA